MATWTAAAVATVVFMSLYKSEDFSQRLNFKIAPHFEFQVISVIGMLVNFVFCYVWEVSNIYLALFSIKTGVNFFCGSFVKVVGISFALSTFSTCRKCRKI